MVHTATVLANVATHMQKPYDARSYFFCLHELIKINDQIAREWVEGLRKYFPELVINQLLEYVKAVAEDQRAKVEMISLQHKEVFDAVAEVTVVLAGWLAPLEFNKPQDKE